MSTNYTTPPAGALEPNPATVVGPILIGTFITWLLMGTLVVQTFIFHLDSASERFMFKVLVYTVVLMDVLQTIFMTHYSWFYTILNFNNPSVLTSAWPWSASTIPIMAGLISGMVQLFYAWRIWILSKDIFMRAMAVLISLIALGQSLAAIIAAAIFSKQPTLPNLLKLHPAFDFWLAGSFSADILISGSMITILYNARTRTSWKQSERMIDRLIINVIQTGTLTVICAGVDLAFFVALESTNLHLAPAIVLGKLYSNSLLATLNYRKRRTVVTNPSASAQSENITMRVQVSKFTERDRMDNTAMNSEWQDSGKPREIVKGSAYDLQEQISV